MTIQPLYRLIIILWNIDIFTALAFSIQIILIWKQSNDQVNNKCNIFFLNLGATPDSTQGLFLEVHRNHMGFRDQTMVGHVKTNTFLLCCSSIPHNEFLFVLIFEQQSVVLRGFSWLCPQGANWLGLSIRCGCHGLILRQIYSNQAPHLLFYPIPWPTTDKWIYIYIYTFIHIYARIYIQLKQKMK